MQLLTAIIYSLMSTNIPRYSCSPSSSSTFISRFSVPSFSIRARSLAHDHVVIPRIPCTWTTEFFNAPPLNYQARLSCLCTRAIDKPKFHLNSAPSQSLHRRALMGMRTQLLFADTTREKQEFFTKEQRNVSSLSFLKNLESSLSKFFFTTCNETHSESFLLQRPGSGVLGSSLVLINGTFARERIRRSYKFAIG